MARFADIFGKQALIGAQTLREQTEREREQRKQALGYLQSKEDREAAKLAHEAQLRLMNLQEKAGMFELEEAKKAAPLLSKKKEFEFEREKLGAERADIMWPIEWESKKKELEDKGTISDLSIDEMRRTILLNKEDREYYIKNIRPLELQAKTINVETARMDLKAGPILKHLETLGKIMAHYQVLADATGQRIQLPNEFLRMYEKDLGYLNEVYGEFGYDFPETPTFIPKPEVKQRLQLGVYGSDYQDLFEEKEAQYDIPASILASIAKVESGFNPKAKSKQNAKGLMQFIPSTAKAYGLTDPYNSEQAVDAGARYLRDLVNKYESWPLAIAAYHDGETNINKLMKIYKVSNGADKDIVIDMLTRGKHPKTKNYVRKVLAAHGAYMSEIEAPETVIIGEEPEFYVGGENEDDLHALHVDYTTGLDDILEPLTEDEVREIMATYNMEVIEPLKKINPSMARILHGQFKKSLYYKTQKQNEKAVETGIALPTEYLPSEAP